MQFQNRTIREIAVEAPLTAKVFEEFKIDYCCGGNVGFVDACKNAGIDPLTVLGKLEALTQRPEASEIIPERFSMTELSDYIVDTHHVYTREAIERLLPLMDKVARKHGALHPELAEVKENFDKLADELLVHMRKEEMVLFPFIKELDEASQSGRYAATPHFGTVQNPVRMMMFEHDTAGDILRKIRELTSDFTLPEGACPSYGALYAGLEELELDLHRHIHLENNVLFPKTVETEARHFDKLIAENVTSCCSLDA
jgi:regulator of cell morphogenesis and NO signaling